MFLGLLIRSARRLDHDYKNVPIPMIVPYELVSKSAGSVALTPTGQKASIAKTVKRRTHIVAWADRCFGCDEEDFFGVGEFSRGVIFTSKVWLDKADGWRYGYSYFHGSDTSHRRD